MPTLLLLTGDPSLRELVARGLGGLGYEVVPVSSREAAIRSLFSVKADGAVVDVSLSDDLDWLRQWRQGAERALPVLFLAAPGVQWLPGVMPLQPGLDEVVIKPCSAQEVKLGLERALAAGHRARSSIILVGSLELDRITHGLKGDSVQVQLTPTEFRLLEYLAQRQGAIASAEELLEKVWEFHPGTGSSELVRSHVRNLRAKVRVVAPGRDLIQTVPRQGYRLVA